ncbi:MAG: LLM class flavin-dependent oxidoreductase [Candidatus Hodarchaeota archaeon]
MVKFSVNHSTSFAIAMFGREEVLKSAKLLEELGNFDGASIMDHINWYPDYAKIYSAWIMATEIAMVTKKLDVGIMVSDVFRTHPVQMAQHALHLQQVANGRFILGLGAGETVNLSPWSIEAEKPVSHLEEAIQVLKLLFESHPKNKATFEGKYYNFKKQYLQFPDYAHPKPKIWLAAGSPRTLKITAKYADGWIPVGCTPKLYKEQAKIVKSENREIEMAQNTFLSISKDDPEQAKNVASLAAAVFVMRPEILSEHGIEMPEKLDFIKHFKFEKVSKHKRHMGHAMEFMNEHVPRDLVLETVLAGSPEDIIKQIKKMKDAGCEHFGLQFLGQDFWGSVKMFSEEVIPHVQD